LLATLWQAGGTGAFLSAGGLAAAGLLTGAGITLALGGGLVGGFRGVSPTSRLTAIWSLLLGLGIVLLQARSAPVASDLLGMALVAAAALSFAALSAGSAWRGALSYVESGYGGGPGSAPHGIVSHAAGLGSRLQRALSRTLPQVLRWLVLVAVLYRIAQRV
jgi:hypothetical protein